MGGGVEDMFGVLIDSKYLLAVQPPQGGIHPFEKGKERAVPCFNPLNTGEKTLSAVGGDREICAVKKLPHL